IVIRYRRSAGAASLQLRWKSAAFDWEPVPPSAFSTSAAPEADEGRRLVREYGCANCHAAPGLERPGPVLTGIASRTNGAWLHAWLENPQPFRSGARMPQLLTAAQRSDAAAFLATLKAGDSGKFRRRVNEVIIGKGNELFGTIGCIACHQQPGLKLSGLGSKYTLDSLTRFLMDPSQVEPAGYMPSMLLNEEDAFALAANLMLSRNPAFENTPPSGDAARGRAVVETSGCLACHELTGARNQKQAKPMMRIAASADCPDARYTMTAPQRQAIAAFLKDYRAHPDRGPAPLFTLGERLREFRCVACHQTDSAGPLATLPEAVPSLAGVGQKLRTSWIDQVLSGKQRIHSQHEIRMPHYSPDQVRGWVPAFAKAEGLAPGDGPEPPNFTSRQNEQGLGLVGTNPGKGGMGCIGCHDWGENKSLGEEGPQLMSLSSRLRFDWYQRWMLNPARILSGTSMPNYFSSTPRPRATETIGLLWAAMHTGRSLPMPDGLKAGGSADAEARPVPDKEAIVIRWDMPEATPAAIAVGLPGKLSYCFDAGESRLLYAWRGGFLDMTGTLYRKTDDKKLTPTAALVGEVFWRSREFPIRTGTRDHIPQRRFRGYKLIGGVPEIHYTVDGIDVFEHLRPVEGALHRQVRFARVDQPMWFEDREIPRGENITLQFTLKEGAQ
ncbi:MAG: c-type cytochrome, partial [Bryobacteraceae bacterium]|nr:c-type cytochrome [Bryobacteraceae bacterium]